jgi:hypothetical protein
MTSNIPPISERAQWRRRTLILPAMSILVLCALIIGNACAPIYTPNAVHTTLAHKQGTIQAGALYGAGAFNGTIDITPLDDVSIIGSFSYEPWSLTGKALEANDSTWPKHMAHDFWETGLGYSIALGTKHLDVIAGFGMGHATALWPKDSNAWVNIYPQLTQLSDSGSPLAGIYRVDGAYRRIFAQATMSQWEEGARGTSDNVGLALRASYVWFTNLEREDRSTLHPRALFFDPIAFVRSGSRNIQIELQGGFSVKVPLNDDQLRVQVLFIELGVHAILEGLW